MSADLLGQVQRQMVRVCLNLKPALTDNAESFCKRRNLLSKQAQSRQGNWSLRWAKQMLKWHGHSTRDPNLAWTRQLLPFLPPAELELRRTLFNRRPDTRAGSGFTNARWCESLKTAQEHVDQNSQQISPSARASPQQFSKLGNVHPLLHSEMDLFLFSC